MKEYLFIEGNRDGYTPEQCYHTLTVGELINILQEFDEDLPVYLRNDNGYTYGSLSAGDINYSQEDEEDEEDEE